VAALTQGKRRTLLETWLEWLYEAAQDAQALVIATECDEFRKLDWDRIRDAMAHPFVLDGRNRFSPHEMKTDGFEYRSFGRSE
jgi:UDPglucose 6-dehydrogenase